MFAFFCLCAIKLRVNAWKDTHKQIFGIYDSLFMTDIKNGRTRLMTTSAPQVMRHSLLTLDSSVLIFFRQRIASSWKLFSFILNFHNASSNTTVISFSFGYSSSKWAIFARILCKIIKLTLLSPHWKLATRIIWKMQSRQTLKGRASTRSVMPHIPRNCIFALKNDLNEKSDACESMLSKWFREVHLFHTK